MCEQLFKGIIYSLAVKITHVLDLAHQKERVALWCSWIQFPPFTGALSLSLFIYHHHHHLSLNREGRWGTTEDFATSFFHFSLLSTAPWELAKSRPGHSLMLSFHLFLCLPCLFTPFPVPCKMVLARPDERETGPDPCSLRLFTMVRRSSCVRVEINESD